MPKHYLRNMILLMGNYVVFGMGMALFSTNTVMPVFLRHLTDSTVLIGFVTSIPALGWMTMQIVAARWIHNKPRRKPYLILLSLGMPIAYSVLAAGLFLAGAGNRVFILILFPCCVLVSAISDGLFGVPWLDFIGKAVPARLRGRMMGIQELLFAVASVGLGALVSYMLGDKAPAFPHNFAWLAVATAAAYWVSILFFLPLHEPEEEDNPTAETTSPPTWNDYFHLLGSILREDRPFVLHIVVRILNGFFNLAYPFFVLYATQELGLPTHLTGLFLSAQLIGSAVGSLVMGYSYDRWGSRLIILLVTAASVLIVVASLLAPVLGLSGLTLQVYFILIFFLMGISTQSTSAFFIAYTNFIIDYAPAERRPAYLGLSSTLSGPISLIALAGGWIVQVLGYQPLFLVTGLVLTVSLLLGFRLPEPRRSAPKAVPPAVGL